MKHYLILILILMSLQSCFKEEYKDEVKKVLKLEQDIYLLEHEKEILNQDIHELRQENKDLLGQVEKYKLKLQTKTNTKYVWTVILYKESILFSDLGGSPMKYKDMVYYSSVTKVKNMSNSIKYKLQDELESSLRIKSFNHDIIIKNRETFVFDSYDDASEHRYNYIN